MQSDKGCNSGKHVMLLEPGRRALTSALGGGSTQASWNRDCEYPFDGKRKKGIFGGGKAWVILGKQENVSPGPLCPRTIVAVGGSDVAGK